MNGRLVGISLVLLSVCIEAFGQVALKKATLSPDKSQQRRNASALGILLLGLEAVIWTMVLKYLDVSIAFPLGALSFATTAIFSALFLKEQISMKRWVGVGTIVCGAACLSIG
jgi:multidrug transporter EmrE-like cation transporter